MSSETRAQVGIGTLIVFIAMVLVAAIAAGVLINTAGFLQNQAEQTGTESVEQVSDSITVNTEVGIVGGEGDERTDFDRIDEVRLGIQPTAGADDINLAELSMQYVSDDNFTNIVVAKDESEFSNDITTAEELDDEMEDSQATGESNPDNVNTQAWDGDILDNVNVEQRFGIEPIKAEQEEDIVMTSSADRYELVINTSGGDFTEFETEDGSVVDVSDFNQSFVGELDEGEEVQLSITTASGSQTVAFLKVPDSLVGAEEDQAINL